MFRRFMFSVGALALLVVLGAPGQLHAQHMRGGGPHMTHPGFRSGFTPGFHGRFDPRFNRGFDRGFDRFEDRFENRFHGPGSMMFFDPRFNRGFFEPHVTPFFPGFFRPF
jgi:hypothetical protein